MNTDDAFFHCDMMLDIAIGIWESRIQSRFAVAEKNYQNAREIYEKYFSQIPCGSTGVEVRKPSLDAVSEWDSFFENNVDPF